MKLSNYHKPLPEQGLILGRFVTLFKELKTVLKQTGDFG